MTDDEGQRKRGHRLVGLRLRHAGKKGVTLRESHERSS